MDLKMTFHSALEYLIQLIEKYWNEINIDSSGLWVNKAWYSSADHLMAFEISYFIEGTTVLNMNNRIYTARKGHFYFSDLSLHSSCSESNFKLYYITFSTRNLELHKQLKLCFSCLSECIQPVSMSGIDDNFMHFHYESSILMPYSKLVAKYLFINILVTFYRYLSNSVSYNSKSLPNSRHKLIVNEVIKYINENYQKNIQIHHLSHIYSLNPRHLNYIFKNITGIPIIKYLIKLRVEKAKRLLSFTSMSITDIALETGFCDCQHFCKTFKKLYGITPSEFRNRLMW